MKSALGALWCGLLGTALAGCGPAPYAIEPDDAQPPPPRVEQVPVIVVQQQAPAVVVAPVLPPPLPDAIAATIQRNHHKFHKCYHKALHRYRGLRGSIVVRVTIDGDGEVTSAKDWGGDLPDRKARECIVDVYEDMEFPPPAGNRVFVHRLDLDPARGGTIR